ncbi:MAG: hypothetical protein N3A61_05460 [Ignavibacteria bacterium]|nr:hypothetical protein [Ignavibacteria bacterium]
METIQISLSEYQSMKEQLKLLKDNELLLKINKLIDLLFEEKYGLYLGNHTEDLTEYFINENLKEKESDWDKL